MSILHVEHLVLHVSKADLGSYVGRIGLLNAPTILSLKDVAESELVTPVVAVGNLETARWLVVLDLVTKQ
jgi:hypothetical protein